LRKLRELTSMRSTSPLWRGKHRTGSKFLRLFVELFVIPEIFQLLWICFDKFIILLIFRSINLYHDVNLSYSFRTIRHIAFSWNDLLWSPSIDLENKKDSALSCLVIVLCQNVYSSFFKNHDNKRRIVRFPPLILLFDKASDTTKQVFQVYENKESIENLSHRSILSIVVGCCKIVCCPDISTTHCVPSSSSVTKKKKKVNIDDSTRSSRVSPKLLLELFSAPFIFHVVFSTYFDIN